jgi:hypothetical protein
MAQVSKRPRQPDGKFAEGQPAPNDIPHRKRGTPNKITRDLKQGIIEGAVKHGFNGKGSGGLTGYLRMCAKKYPKAYLSLLGRLLPLTVKSDENLIGNLISAVNIVTVPTGRFLSAEDIQQLMPVLPVMIGSPP